MYNAAFLKQSVTLKCEVVFDERGCVFFSPIGPSNVYQDKVSHDISGITMPTTDPDHPIIAYNQPTPYAILGHRVIESDPATPSDEAYLAPQNPDAPLTLEALTSIFRTNPLLTYLCCYVIISANPDGSKYSLGMIHKKHAYLQYGAVATMGGIDFQPMGFLRPLFQENDTELYLTGLATATEPSIPLFNRITTQQGVSSRGIESSDPAADEIFLASRQNFRQSSWTLLCDVYQRFLAETTFGLFRYALVYFDFSGLYVLGSVQTKRPGCDLFDYLVDDKGQCRAFPPEDSLDLTEAILHAYTEIERAGWQQFDVKHDNMLVVRDPVTNKHTVHVIDHGLSAATPYQDFLFRGSLPFAAPELRLSGCYNHRIDVYALSCILLHALAPSCYFSIDIQRQVDAQMNKFYSNAEYITGHCKAILAEMSTRFGTTRAEALFALMTRMGHIDPDCRPSIQEALLEYQAICSDATSCVTPESTALTTESPTHISEALATPLTERRSVSPFLRKALTAPSALSPAPFNVVP